MPAVQSFVAIVLLSVAMSGAHAAPAEAALCKDAVTESEMADCFARHLKSANAAVKAAHRTLVARYKEYGGPTGYSFPSQEVYLEKSHRAWVQWRKATCDFETYESRTGTGFGTIYTACLLKETQKRVDYLNDLVSTP